VVSYDCSCDYDPATVYSARMVRARKEYRCEECPNRIMVGEQHEYTFGVWDGCASQFRTCFDCVDRRKWVRNNLPCFCWAHGNLLDDIKSAIEEAYWRARDEVRGVAFGYGRLLINQRRARASTA
jgi:hypothetical protein